MPGLAVMRRRQGVNTTLATGALVLLLAAALAFAAQADLAEYRDPAVVLGDLVVGLAFPVAALVARTDGRARAVMATVGLAWLAGSIWSFALTLHLAVLCVALICCTEGLLPARRWWTLVGCAAVMAAQVLPQLAIGAMFLAVAAAFLTTPARRGQWYAPAAALVTGVAMVYSWAVNHSGGVVAPGIYQGAMLAVAVLFPVASRTAGLTSSGLSADELAKSGEGGILGLEAALRHVLGDPALRLVTDGAAGPGLMVTANDAVVGRVEGAPRALADAATASAVSAAVRLAVEHQRLSERHSRRAAELERSTGRLQSAVDRQRARARRILQAEVDPPVRSATRQLAALGRLSTDRDGEDTVADLVAALERVTEDLRRIVASGAAPSDLGGGRIRQALPGLLLHAQRAGLLVHLRLDPDLAGDQTSESALFFTCAEALANAAKHSASTHVQVEASRSGGYLQLIVSDNGRGGADPEGSGLVGVRDRLTAAGGGLQVSGAAGHGTQVRATVPAFRGSDQTAGARRHNQGVSQGHRPIGAYEPPLRPTQG